MEDSAIAVGGDANSGHQSDSQNDLSVGDVTYAPDYSEDNDTVTIEDNQVAIGEDADASDDYQSDILSDNFSHNDPVVVLDPVS